VDNNVVYPDQSYPPHFKITKNGHFTRFESTTGLIVEYDGSWVGLIKLPDSYADKVDGLCGNFDGDADNDMRTSTKVLTTNYAEVGNSWQVTDSADSR
jgi:alpha-tectorin